MQNTPHTKQSRAAQAGAVQVKRAASAYGLRGRWVTVTVLPDCNRGRNARGTAGHKVGWGGGVPRHAKRAKRQGAERMGNSPRIARTNPYPV